MLAALIEIILDAGLRPVNSPGAVPPATEPEVLMIDGVALMMDNEVLVL